MDNYGFNIRTAVVDCGASIAVAVGRGGKRTAVRVPNPFWEEINAEWHADPHHKCAVPGCAYCDAA